MKTKNIFKVLAFVMLMPAMMLTTACSNDDDAVNNDNTAKKGYALPVTINITRQGEGTTRTSYNDVTRKLSFSTGDKLFVQGEDKSVGGAGKFAGTLTWKSAGTFSGTIITQNDYSGTADALLTAAEASSGGWTRATLLPNDYGNYGFLNIIKNDGFDDVVYENKSNAFVLTKAEAIEQLSYEFSNCYSNGFELIPSYAILNFTITGLTADAKVTASLTDNSSRVISGEVTTNGSGNATFVIAVIGNTDLNYVSLTVGSSNIAIVNARKYAEAGKIYNITRSAASAPAPSIPEGAINGHFTVNASCNQVYFAQGNLQATYNGSAWIWAFAEHQYDYIGDNTGNTKVTNSSPFISENATVDLFGWVGTSSTWNGVNQYGITSSYFNNNTNGYGIYASEALKSDWGTLAITNGGNTANSGWRTLTSSEWTYVFNTRISGSTVNGTDNARYTLATINTVNGIILFPDGVTIASSEATTWGTINGISAWGTKCTFAQWAALAAKGCVFLPAAGSRNMATVIAVKTYGYYWSSSPSTVSDAYSLRFDSGHLNPADSFNRNYGHSVRLVHNVE